ncbi:54S ribosomal protein L25, mitochondrial-like [Teratosphaeria destructans]|uniref:54S ribosomal protein L25, mitochondrial-like n=1 Tax=Teratosphaeria destructans TaxID=418781 RepID=A0A9W7STW6_9PEZI|nr:54S ribosomal protein L25, mitochondrial-like [Teratosphaeria destructans]
MAAVAAEVQIARELPKRLLSFFKRFPPPQIQTVAPSTVQIAENTSSADPNAATSTSVPVEPMTTNARWKKNPFLPFKNPSTGIWHGPHYSLRRQADLFKLAQAHGVLSLMPTSPKHPEVKAQRRIEHGLRVKGTGEGQRVKGHYWERTLKTRLQLRQKAMEAMPDMITLWKLRGHGRGWKKYPSGKTKGKGAGAGENDIFKSEMMHAWVNQRAPTS